VSHGLVEPLQEDDERIVRLSLRLCSHLPRQHQGSQCDQSAADCGFSVDHGLVGDRRELHDSSPSGSDSPLRLEQGCLLSQRGKRLGVAEARRWRPKRRCCATQPAEHRTLPCSYQMCQAQWRGQGNSPGPASSHLTHGLGPHASSGGSISPNQRPPSRAQVFRNVP